MRCLHVFIYNSSLFDIGAAFMDFQRGMPWSYQFVALVLACFERYVEQDLLQIVP